MLAGLAKLVRSNNSFQGFLAAIVLPA